WHRRSSRPLRWSSGVASQESILASERRFLLRRSPERRWCECANRPFSADHPALITRFATTGVSRETSASQGRALSASASAQPNRRERPKGHSFRTSFVTCLMAGGGGRGGYFRDAGKVPPPRRREGSGSRATPQFAEAPPPIHEPPLRRDRGGHHGPRRG